MTGGISSTRRYVVQGRSSESDRLLPTACKNVLGPWKASSLNPLLPVPVRSSVFFSAVAHAAVVVVVVVVECGGCVARNLLFGGDSSSMAAPLRGPRIRGGGDWRCLFVVDQTK